MLMGSDSVFHGVSETLGEECFRTTGFQIGQYVCNQARLIE